MELLTSLMTIDLLITLGVVIGITAWMKKTGESFQQVCLRIREIFTRK